MKITQKQVIKMYEMLLLATQPYTSLTSEGKEMIHTLLKEIRNQQSEVIIELQDDESEEKSS